MAGETQNETGIFDHIIDGTKKLFNDEAVSSKEHFWSTAAIGIGIAAVMSKVTRNNVAQGKEPVLYLFG